MTAKPRPLERFGTLSSDGPMANAKYSLFISRVMEKLHSRIPRENYIVSKAAAPVDYREEFFENENHSRAVLFLRSNGCEWAMRRAQGCTMCGHLAKQTRLLTPLSSEDLFSQFREAFESINFDETPILNLYNNGSFFNENELPELARVKMLRAVRDQKRIRMLVVESRPEFITEELMAQTKALLPDVHVEVAMGLETIDDYKRMISVNKGFTLKKYDRAVQIIRKYHLHPRSYVLLKPPFFSEREGIEEAVKTIEYAFNAGASTVSLEACTLQKYTLTEYLINNGLYRLAKLWSILEVVKKTHRLGKLIVGMFQFYPSPEDVPFNCGRCSDRVLDALIRYNRTLRVESFEGLDCDCRADWEDDLCRDHETFEDRIEAFRIRAIEDKLVDWPPTGSAP